MVGRRNVNIWGAAPLAAAAAFFACLLMLVTCSSALAAPLQYELVERFGPDGSEGTKFAAPGPVAVDQQSDLVYAADNEAGKLYKFTIDGTAVNWGGSAGYISGNEISNLSLFNVFVEGESQVAVDSATHTVYVTDADTIRAFQADGEPSEFTAVGSSTIGGFGSLAGLAVDTHGYIYASDRTGGVVKIFTPSGELVTEFSTPEPANLAVDSAGSVYVTRFVEPVTKFTPSPFPVTSATTYTADTEPVDDSAAYTVAVDPATNEVYIGRVRSEAAVAVYDENGNPVTEFGEAGSAGELETINGIAVDSGSKKVYVGNGFNEGSSQVAQVSVFKPKPPAPPAVIDLAATGISANSAELYALINPNSASTTYYFEFGPADCSVSICATIPIGGAPVGTGNDDVWVSQKLQGLTPGTTYHYRVVAENGLGAVQSKGLFTTQGNGLNFKLSDSRVWEMVSPPNKRGAQLLGTVNEGGQVQAAADGSGIAYISVGSIEGSPEGSRVFEASSVLARRDASGWHSEDITPPNSKTAPISIGNLGEYKLFSPDLLKAVLVPRSETALSPEASEWTPYLRENSKPPSYKPLVTGKDGFSNVPPGTKFGGGRASAVTIINATPDLSHVLLKSSVPLAAGASTQSIYRWTGGQLEPISVLPEGGGAIAAFAGSEAVGGRHSISNDGSRVFWTPQSNPHLYVRDLEANETAMLDVAPTGASSEAQPVFQGASANGRVVFFTDTQQLTGDGSPEGADLYRCEIAHPAEGCASLMNLTAATSSPEESAQVLGVISALSDDGSRLYFFARGALSAEPNQFGQEPTAGEPNLYFWEEGKGLRFIVTAAPEDSPDWGETANVAPPGGASQLSASSSPDGRYFAFMSEHKLTDPQHGTDPNLDPRTGDAVQNVFRYDAATRRLICPSCAPTGAAPHGALVEHEDALVDPRGQWLGRRVAAVLPQPETVNVGGTFGPLTIYQPRFVLDNGRVFFNAIDSIVPGDSNGQWDIYQYEDRGLGDCSETVGGAAIARSAEGCVSLISSGTGSGRAGFLDASASGDDVFFLTPTRLASTDVDEELDVYDARVNGVPTILSSPIECNGESCRGATSQPPGVAPSSAFFAGSGNVKSQKRCPRGKRRVKRRGRQRCVQRKTRKHHQRSSRRKGARG